MDHKLEGCQNDAVSYYKYLFSPHSSPSSIKTINIPEHRGDGSFFSIRYTEGYLVANGDFYVPGMLYTGMGDPSITECSAYVYQYDIDTDTTQGFTLVDNVNDAEDPRRLFDLDGGIGFAGIQHTDVSTLTKSHEGEMFIGKIDYSGAISWIKAVDYESGGFNPSNPVEINGNAVLFSTALSRHGLSYMTLTGSGAYSVSFVSCDPYNTEFFSTASGGTWVTHKNSLHLIQPTP